MSTELSEPRSINLWLVANIRLWGWVPSALVFLIIKLTNTEGNLADISLYWLIASIAATTIFTMGTDGEYPKSWYTLITILFVGILFMAYKGVWDDMGLNDSIKAKAIIAIIIGLTAACLIGIYINKYYLYIIPKLYRFRTSNIDWFESKVGFIYMRFIETFFYTFITVLSLSFLA